MKSKIPLDGARKSMFPSRRLFRSTVYCTPLGVCGRVRRGLHRRRSTQEFFSSFFCFSTTLSFCGDRLTFSRGRGLGVVSYALLLTAESNVESPRGHSPHCRMVCEQEKEIVFLHRDSDAHPSRHDVLRLPSEQPRRVIVDMIQHKETTKQHSQEYLLMATSLRNMISYTNVGLKNTRTMREGENDRCLHQRLSWTQRGQYHALHYCSAKPCGCY